MSEPRVTPKLTPARTFAATRTSLERLTPSLLAAMAPKAADAAYVNRDVPLPDARRDDWGEIARFLALANQLTHSGGAAPRLCTT